MTITLGCLRYLQCTQIVKTATGSAQLSQLVYCLVMCDVSFPSQHWRSIINCLVNWTLVKRSRLVCHIRTITLLSIIFIGLCMMFRSRSLRRTLFRSSASRSFGGISANSTVASSGTVPYLLIIQIATFYCSLTRLPRFLTAFVAAYVKIGAACICLFSTTELSSFIFPCNELPTFCVMRNISSAIVTVLLVITLMCRENNRLPSSSTFNVCRYPRLIGSK